MPFKLNKLSLGSLPLVLVISLATGCTGFKPILQDSSLATAFTVVKIFPHDREAFTEGLAFYDGKLFESTGLNGASSVREVDLQTGQVIRSKLLPSEFFGEGLTALHGKLFQLTWQEHRAFVYDPATFRTEREIPYRGEGWGLTTDGTSLIVSDGTSSIKFVRPDDFATLWTIKVQLRGHAVRDLNELEYVHGEIWANVWHTETIIRIDPKTGNVIGTLNLQGLLSAENQKPTEHSSTPGVLNGIAYNPANDHVYVTGKNWPVFFELEIKSRPTPPASLPQ